MMGETYLKFLRILEPLTLTGLMVIAVARISARNTLRGASPPAK